MRMMILPIYVIKHKDLSIILIRCESIVYLIHSHHNERLFKSMTSEFYSSSYSI